MPFFATAALVVQWFVLLIIPDIARPGIFFGVTVAPGFEASAEGLGVRRVYRGVLSLSSLGALICLHGVPWDPPAAMIAAFQLQLASSVGAWIWANRRVKPFARSIAPAPTASLIPRPTALPGGWAFFLGPILTTGLAAGFLILNWSSIPDPVPVHWNIQGEPDQWEDRTPGVVFRPLLIVAFTSVVMLIMARYILLKTRRISVDSPASGREVHFKRFNYFVLVLSAYATALMGAVLATQIGADPGPAFPVLPVMAAPVAIMAAVLFYALRYGQGGVAGMGAEGAGDRTPDACWKWGIFYYNPDDPALLVEKRMGYGWTFNFANRWAWLFILSMGALPLLMWWFG